MRRPEEFRHPELGSRLIAIVEKYAGMAAEYSSNLEYDLALDSLSKEWIAEECFEELCPHLQQEDAERNLDTVCALETVEELIQYFEEAAPAPSLRRPWRNRARERDFSFRWADKG